MKLYHCCGNLISPPLTPEYNTVKKYNLVIAARTYEKHPTEHSE